LKKTKPGICNEDAWKSSSKTINKIIKQERRVKGKLIDSSTNGHNCDGNEILI